MNICVSGHDFDGDDEQAARVVRALRSHGFNNVYTGVARPSRGDMALGDVLHLVQLVNEARGVITPDEWPIGGMETPEDWAALAVFAAARRGHEPLKVLAPVWSAWDVYKRTEMVYEYVERCKKAERQAAEDKPQKLIVNGSARLQTAVSLVVKAMPVNDRLMLDYERVEVVGVPGLWPNEGLGGKAQALEGGGYRIEIDTAVDNKRLLHTVAHEFLHVTRRHTDLLKFAEGEEAYRTLTAVFERQVKALVGRLAYDAVPEFTLH